MTKAVRTCQATKRKPERGDSSTEATSPAQPQPILQQTRGCQAKELSRDVDAVMGQGQKWTQNMLRRRCPPNTPYFRWRPRRSEQVKQGWTSKSQVAAPRLALH